MCSRSRMHVQHIGCGIRMCVVSCALPCRIGNPYVAAHTHTHTHGIIITKTIFSLSALFWFSFSPLFTVSVLPSHMCVFSSSLQIHFSAFRVIVAIAVAVVVDVVQSYSSNILLVASLQSHSTLQTVQTNPSNI